MMDEGESRARRGAAARSRPSAGGGLRRRHRAHQAGAPAPGQARELVGEAHPGAHAGHRARRPRAGSCPSRSAWPLVIAPWNYPIQLLVEPIGGGARGRQLRAGQALRAGARAARPPWRASSRSTSTRRRVIVVEGGVDETTALLAERWDHIFFTGSTDRRPDRGRGRRPAPHADGPRARRQVADLRARQRRSRRGGAPHRLGQVPQRRSDLHRPRLRARRPRGEGRAGRQAHQAGRAPSTAPTRRRARASAAS